MDGCISHPFCSLGWWSRLVPALFSPSLESVSSKKVDSTAERDLTAALHM